ncbi:hypothetical protein HMPREF1568_0809 [Providencia alcalifaciens PAL-3]|nr:hypothetical protein HMPREF1568_0809 [Providencia alcalifaciens PAL-3]EUD01116.1 hypothetical protein HMPREF1566_3399 [Providencia alcalifaciens PAL-1]
MHLIGEQPLIISPHFNPLHPKKQKFNIWHDACFISFTFSKRQGDL